MIQYPARLVEQLHLLPGVTILKKGVYMRQKVEGDRVRIDFRFIFLAIQQGLGLLLQFMDGSSAGSGYRLVGGNKKTL